MKNKMEDFWALLSWIVGGAAGMTVGGHFLGLPGIALGLISGVVVGYLILPFNEQTTEASKK